MNKFGRRRFALFSLIVFFIQPILSVCYAADDRGLSRTRDRDLTGLSWLDWANAGVVQCPTWSFQRRQSSNCSAWATTTTTVRFKGEPLFLGCRSHLFPDRFEIFPIARVGCDRCTAKNPPCIHEHDEVALFCAFQPPSACTVSLFAAAELGEKGISACPLWKGHSPGSEPQLCR